MENTQCPIIAQFLVMALCIWNNGCLVILSQFLAAQDDNAEMSHIYIWTILPSFKCHCVFLDIKKGGSIFFQHIAQHVIFKQDTMHALF